jgi:CheY-like chemotaxis protein
MNTGAPDIFLVVDDDAVSILAVRRAFRQLGAQTDVLAVSSAEAALDVLSMRAPAKGSNPQLQGILLDLNMPGMTGPEFLDEIRTITVFNGLKVLVFSADAGASLSQEQRAQVAGYLDKDRLLETLRTALDTRARDNAPRRCQAEREAQAETHLVKGAGG